MTVSIGQVSYSLYPAVGVPGMLADNEVNHIVSFQAAETINPGRAVELAADGVSVQQVQGTGGSAYPFMGFAILLTSREGTGNANTGAAQGGIYSAGDEVPVLRKGSLFAEWKGTTQPAYAVPNVYHSSTIATDRGKITDAGTSAGAGTEVSLCAAAVMTRAALPGTGSVVLVDVNFPSKT